MAVTRREALALSALALCSSQIAGGAEHEARFHTRLSPVASDIMMRANIAGVGNAEGVLDGQKLSIQGNFEGLRSSATECHLHLGPAAGVRGPAIADLQVAKAEQGKINGEVTLTVEQTEALRKGRIYVQLSSEKAPEGNLWGWLMPVGGRHEA